MHADSYGKAHIISMKRYEGLDNLEDFRRDKEALDMEMGDYVSYYNEACGNHKTLLQKYGPNCIGIVHSRLNSDLFEEGHVIRAETSSGYEAREFIESIQREIAPLTRRPVSSYDASELMVEGRMNLLETIYFCDHLIDEKLLIYVNEK